MCPREWTVQASPSLAEKLPTLKSLTVDLGFYDPGGLVRRSQIKYTVTVEHAKSVFRVGCHNQECVRGDFDLSDVIATAVAEKRTSISGELRCQGWVPQRVIPGSGDPRTLGVQLRRVTLRARGAPAKPFNAN